MPRMLSLDEDGKQRYRGFDSSLIPRADITFEPNSSLCTNCQVIISTDIVNEYMLLQPSYESLLGSATECELCGLISRTIPRVMSHAGRNYLLPTCKFSDLIERADVKIWAVKRFRLGLMAEISGESIAHLEIIMKCATPGINQNLATIPAGTAVNSKDNIFYGSGPPPEGYIWGLERDTNMWLGSERSERQCVSVLEHSKVRGSYTDVLPTNPSFDEITTLHRHQEKGAYHRVILNVNSIPEHISKLFPTAKIVHEDYQAHLEDSRLKLAQHWLNQCLQSPDHEECKLWREKKSSLPSRVIDVRPQIPKLYETQPNDRDKYVCLSHRWGGDQIITSTTKTINNHKIGIRLLDMPQTFQDAVRIARHLNYPYLWIDSLCILQDDPNDWGKEAEKMGSYYRNAEFTIVAAAATGSGSGCFLKDVDISTRSRFPSELGTFHIKQSCNEDHEKDHRVKIFATETAAKLAFVPDTAGFRGRGPLDTRGWVLQEEILSPRSLIFSEDGLHWECVSMSNSESKPEAVPWTHTTTVSNQKEHLTFTDSSFSRRFKRLILSKQDASRGDTRTSGGPTNTKLPTLDDTWMSMIENYTGRDLTYEKDRLPAIKGLIEVMRKSLGIVLEESFWGRDSDRVREGVERLGTSESGTIDCLWGLWSVRQLLWHIPIAEELVMTQCDCSESSSGSRATLYIQRPPRDTKSPVPPSWSWMNANQKVSYKTIFKTDTSIRDRSLVQILEAPTRKHLVIQGAIKPIATARKIDPNFPTPDVTYSSATKRERAIVQKSPDDVQSDQDEFFPDHANWTPSKFMCLPVLEIERVLAREPVLVCLILEPTEASWLENDDADPFEFEFRRVGIATLGAVWKPYFNISGRAHFVKAEEPVIISII